MFIRITEAVELEQLSCVGNRVKIHPLLLSGSLQIFLVFVICHRGGCCGSRRVEAFASLIDKG